MDLLHKTIPIFLILFLLSTFHVESRLTTEDVATLFRTSSSSSPNATEQGTKWAVLVAGSRGFVNYRHQADICHAYQILKRGGLKDENIVVFMYDDIADDEENPRKGIIINHPKGRDVYKGVPKDYTGANLTTHNLFAAILGNETAIKGGSGKVVKSGPNDHIFIYYSDHGSPGVLGMPNMGDEIIASDFIKTLKLKHKSGTYKSMVIYVEACEAGSIFDGLLEKEWNIYATTASNPSESSFGTYCPGMKPFPPKGFTTCLGDLYSVAWMEDSETHDLQSETIQEQYKSVKTRVGKGKPYGSHVMEYGNISLSQEPLSIYIGTNHTSNHTKVQPGFSSAVEQHDADILYLREKVRIAPEGSDKRAQAQKELDETLSHRKHVDSTMEAIGEAIFGASKGYEMLKTVRSPGKPIVDDWNCFKTMIETYKLHCGPLSTYGKKHTRVFANMCNAGVQKDQLAEITSKVCKNN